MPWATRSGARRTGAHHAAPGCRSDESTHGTRRVGRPSSGPASRLGWYSVSDLTLEVSVPSGAFDLGEILQHEAVSRVELVQFVPMGSSLAPYFHVETGDREAFERDVRADERVAELTHHDGTAGKHLYSVEWAGDLDGFLAALRDHDLLIERGVGNGTRWRFRLRGADDGNVSSFQEALREHDISLDVRRVQQISESATDAYGVTDKQREVLHRAYDVGYFEVPKRTSLDPIADDLDISTQAVSGRLNRGIDNLLENTIVFER